ncbi:MAG: GYD domain-containing protein [Dehalococcoidia bacterium]|nr:GYD domain-containing protein [Dehalococcoidia bacterium]
MARYLIQVSYTSESWATQVANPTNRLEAVANMLAPAGIKFVDSYYAFGEFDMVVIADGPDNVSTAAGVIAVAAGGAVSKLQTTPLLTPEEGLAAITKAGSIGYSPAVS